MTRSVILFGGTFNPPHLGHLMMATFALEQADADEVWFVPSPDPPHKQGERHIPFHVRVDMVRHLLSTDEALRRHFLVSTLEDELLRPSYSVDTVKAYKERYPDVEFRFLIGLDSLFDLPTWHRASELVREIEFLVADRTGLAFDATLQQVKSALPALVAARVEMPLLEISSTWIRQRLHEGRSVCGLVPNEVLKLLPTALL